LEFRIWHKVDNEMIKDIRILPEYGWGLYSDNDAMSERKRTSPDDLVWMQSTGLLDKNRTKIFGGDILSTPGRGLVECAYQPGAFTYRTIKKALVDYRLDEVEVIGNVFENPDLLKSEEKS
jgi:hypothetical protein